MFQFFSQIDTLHYVYGFLNIFFKKFGFPCHLIDGERLLSVVVKVVSFVVKKLLDFYNTTFSILPSLFKI